jgi:hypothetical protein
MTPKRVSGLRKEEPKRNLEDFNYLMRYLSPKPDFFAEGQCFALRFKDGSLVYIHHHFGREYLFSHMMDLARFLNAELITVKGSWVWAADMPLVIERFHQLDQEEEGPSN